MLCAKFQFFSWCGFKYRGPKFFRFLNMAATNATYDVIIIIKIFDVSSRTNAENFVSIRQAIAEKNMKVLCRQTDRQMKNHSKSDNLVKQHKVEWHSVECISLSGGTVHVLYPTDGLDPNQNPIRLFLSPTQLIHLVLS